MQKVDVCINTTRGPQTFKSVRSVFQQALQSEVDLRIITLPVQARSDAILMYHNSDNSGWSCMNKLGLHFLHDTMTMHMRESFSPDSLRDGPEYIPVANCGLMRDLFYQRRLASFPHMEGRVEVVNNYPDWKLSSHVHELQSGYLWLTRISSADKAKWYSEFIRLCKSRNVTPTVISSVEPPDLGYPINWIATIKYEELGDYISRFEYGFGIGRSVLDMITCGLKVVVCGHRLSLNVNEETIERHIYSNFNSHATESFASMDELIETTTVAKDLLLSTMTRGRMFSELETICNKHGASLKSV